MKKLYSIVLMAAALLLSTNAWADASVSTWAELKTALQAGGTVTLSTDINVAGLTAANCIWIGSETQDGDAPAAVLNLNGHNITIKPAVNAINPFALTKGSLKVTSSSPATIEVQEGDVVINTGTNVFTVFGADVDHMQDPETNPFSHLEIDANVTVKTENGTVIAVDELTAAQGAITNLPSPKPTYTTHRYAFGACVDVKGTLISQGAKTKSQGTDGQKCYGIKINGSVDYVPADSEKPYAAYVHVHPSAVITTDYTFAKAAACYASGYGRWLIEGTCTGAIGVYAGKGDIVIKDATVKSGAETYVAPTSAGGANGSGSGVVINSRGGTYDGEVHVTVTGDSKVESKDGYAIEERVNTTDGETNVSSLTISGGTFVGDQEKGAIIVTETTATSTTTTISVAGGNVTGTTGVIGTDSLATYLNKQSDTHATLVTDAQGNTTLVISGGEAPSGMADFVSNADLSVKWTGASKDITGTFALKELEINESTPQVLTVKQNTTFTVERVILGANAKIIVEAGGKFIVTGNQGIVAPSDHNIILKASESQQAYFIFHPSVTSNRHPNATVEFSSKGYYVSNSDFANQRFGLPTFEGLDSITTKYNNADVATGFGAFDGNDWVVLGFINMTPALDLADMAEPFTYYQMQHNAPAMGTMVRMYGKLYGNTSPELDIKGSRWNAFANSFSAPIDGQTLINLIPNSVDKTFYLYDITKDQAVWKSYTLLNINMQGGIRPMQPFLIRNTKGAANVMVDYQQAVYNPAIGAAAGAPARRTLDDITKAELIVNGEHGVDYVLVAENSQFTAEFDNGYDAAKYMNDGINMYVSADEKMSIFATDNLENTYVGFQTVNGGNYTIEFANVQGEELTLVDHETGAEVLMVEGNTYEFAAAANSANDYRFEIVSPRKVTTAIENAEAVKNVKGIYTITGQYVGEMNVWNSLPAGVYVVNGEKRVK